VLSRLMAGTRLSVLTALEAVGIGLVIGAPLGVATVFLGRTFDFVANRVGDALMTLPSIFFAVAVTAALGNGLVQAMFPVGILLIPYFFRITRAATIEFARAQYVEAAELLGGSRLHVIRVHVVRKVFPTIAVTTASLTGAALLSVSFLTFLGIGVQPPTPTWGGVLSSDLNYLNLAPWAPFIPGALIAVTVGALNALADAYRDKAGPGTLLLPEADPASLTHSTLEAADARQPAA
jgi:peptide/nickel transport system permease protein